jgi:hypothetical protein
MSDHLILQVKAQQTQEDAFFAQQEREQIKDLRAQLAHDSSHKYREEHQYHCFRCGTRSLVEVQKGKIAVDICVNENCGAVHLDAGELDALLEDRDFIKKARRGIFDIFK